MDTQTRSTLEHVERIKAMCNQEWPAAERFSKADMLAVLARLEEVERDAQYFITHGNAAIRATNRLIRLIGRTAEMAEIVEEAHDILSEEVINAATVEEQRTADVRALVAAAEALMAAHWWKITAMPIEVDEALNDALAKVRLWAGEKK